MVVSNFSNSMDVDSSFLADHVNGQARAKIGYRPVSPDFAIAPSVSVILPVMNEASNLPHVFATLPAWVDEVVLVDGHSIDETVAVTRRLRPDIKIVTQPGTGKGDALLAGCAASTSDIIVMIDGDGSTDGREIIQFVSALVAGADFAKGSRFSSGGSSDDITISRRAGNKFLNVLVNRLFGARYSDLCYGYNAFWSRHLSDLAIDCPGFEVEALMGIRAAKAGLVIQEIPSHELPRLYGRSNLNAVRDGWRILKLILRERFGSPQRSGYPSSPPVVRLEAVGAGVSVESGGEPQ
jgi:glycosyltransferase involved in cell wall biosynthesis